MGWRELVALPLSRAYRQALEHLRGLPFALAGFDLALTLLPASAETKRSIKQHQNARLEAERSLARDPDNGAAWHKLGDALFALKRGKQAIACYDQALAMEPENPSVWRSRTIARETTGETTNRPLIPFEPQDAKAWLVQGGDRFHSRRYADAIVASDRALALDSQNIAALRLGIHCRILTCDWTRCEDDKRRVSEGLRDGTRLIAPLYHLAICNSEAENLALARLWSNGALPPQPQWRGERYGHDKIRIAYLSADFRNNVLADVIAGCFEHHDKTRFETTAISLGRDDGSALRRRIAASFDRFVDARTLADAEVATMLRGLEIDIAIDLQGLTGENRTHIFAYRPAPVQVNYLAYPGTIGVPFIDYIIADRVVIPEEHQPHYSEKVVYLPQSYLPNDAKSLRLGRTPSRAEEGLPETGFVFACFNHAIKIRPEIFDVWMRLLREFGASVLWLRSTNTASRSNLRREAARRGVDPQRIVFASRKPSPVHLARQTLADLFLDTLPYNAHSTASEALWVGLPVVTCLGNTFPGRVAASLLQAIGLPELIAASLAEYEELARTLARNPELLAATKSKLMQNRQTSRLFDTARFTRDLEAAYEMMWQRSQRGQRPESFAVSPSDFQSSLLPNERAKS